MDPDQTAHLGHTVCLYAKCKFEKFARTCSRRHKQTTFSDADLLGALRVNVLISERGALLLTFLLYSVFLDHNISVFEPGGSIPCKVAFAPRKVSDQPAQADQSWLPA